MQRFKNGDIYLDKTIALSKQIVKGNVLPSEALEVEYIFGEMFSFNFKHINSSPSLPIEHIGLAQLVYEKAVDQFHTKVVKENGETEKVFEKLPEGYHIADVLKECAPDVLAWYKNANGEALKFPTKFDGKATNTDLNRYEKTIDFNKEGENTSSPISDRFRTVSYAVCEALCQYEECLAIQNNSEENEAVSAEEPSSVAVEEAKVLNKALLELKENTYSYFYNNTQAENQTVVEQTSSATEEAAQ